MIKQIADYDDRAGGDNEIAGSGFSQRLIQRLSTECVIDASRPISAAMATSCSGVAERG